MKEAALLFESGSYLKLHKVIVVTSPIDTRIERIIKRDNVKREDILKRIENQMTDRERLNKADFVIYNDGKHSLIEQTMKVHREVLQLQSEEAIPLKA
jgi:dephospho-CoA kinase